MHFPLFSLCVSLVVVSLAASSSEVKDRHVPGFGVQRLKKNQKKNGPLKSATSCDNVEEFYYTDAVVDNFAPIEKQARWAGKGQRYWWNKQFWGGVGFPLFVFIGGEGEESCSRLTNHMYLFDLAKKHNALLVNVEHRFYGESYPTADMSTQSLSYLSSDQALADLARVISHVKSTLNTDQSTVITVGGSYPGNLAAWFRLKYPSVTQGSIASSAPVIAKSNFYEYMEVVGQSIIWFGGQSCYDNIEKATQTIQSYYSQGVGSEGMEMIQRDFNTCQNITGTKDLQVLLSDLMGNVQGTIQYNNEHIDVMNVSSIGNENSICSVMLAGNDPYQQFVQLQSLYLTANGQTCNDASWKDTVEYLSASKKDPSNAARPWTYQTCNEFGYFQTADSKNQPFNSWKELDLSFSMDICSASFNGWSAKPQTDWINEKYGNIYIASTNTAFPSGTIDPWHALGVQNSTARFLPESSDHAVFIQGTAHCNDLYAPASSDPSSLTQARKEIADLVDKWLHKAQK